MSAYHALRYLGILPFVSGPLPFRGQDRPGAVLRALCAPIWGLGTVMLGRGNQHGRLFEVKIPALGSILAGPSIPGASTPRARTSEILPDGAVLLSSLMPGVEDASGVESTVTYHR